MLKGISLAQQRKLAEKKAKEEDENEKKTKKDKGDKKGKGAKAAEKEVEKKTDGKGIFQYLPYYW